MVKKHWLHIVLLVALLLCVVIPNGYPVQAQELQQEVIELRQENSKTYDLGNSTYRKVISSGVIHYKDNYSDGNELWKDIILKWDGKRLVTTPYELIVGINEVRFTDKRTGDYVIIAPDSIGLTKSNLSSFVIVPFNEGIQLQRTITADKIELTSTYNVDIQGKSVNIVARARDADGAELPVEYTIKDGLLTETITSLLTEDGKAAKFPITCDPQLIIQPNGSGEDTYISKFSPTTNNGNGEGAYVGNDYAFLQFLYRALVEFTIPWGTGVGQIPLDATIDTATFSLYVASVVGSDTYYASRLLRLDWVETQATWNIYKTGSSWTTAGCDSNGNDYTTTNQVGITVSSTGWKNWVITSQVQTAQSSSINVGIRVSGTSTAYGDVKYFLCRMSDYSTDPTQRPKLVIDYTPLGALPTVDTLAATDVEDTTATLNGEVTDDGGLTIDYYGFVWGESDEGDPGDVDPSTPAGTWENGWKSGVGDYGENTFEHDITGLPTGTTIYFRAAAHNSLGWAYGEAEDFLTKPAAPTNVAATDGAHNDKVVVTWTKSTGATGYKVYEGVNLLDTLGDVASYDDTAAPAGIITPGTTLATDGSHTDYVGLSLSGASTANGSSRTYKVVAFNDAGDSDDSSTDTGYRGIGSLNYQWQRSAGDSDASYSNIVGATSSTYNDIDAPEPTLDAGNATATDGTSIYYVTLNLTGESVTDGAGRYYKCELSADGATNQTSASDRGYRGTTSLTYQWQRSNADSDADYVNIVGATSYPYNDTGGVVEPDGRYYQCVVSMVGIDSQNSTSDRGYMKAILAPTVTSSNATMIENTRAILHGNVTASEVVILTRGFQWGYSSGNYTYNWTESDAFSIGAYSRQITGLTSNTTVYWRAFATNVAGIGYSGELQFTTLALALPSAPTNFVATVIELDLLGANWTLGWLADSTIVVVKEGSYPTDMTDGVIVYNGTNEYLTYWGLDLDSRTYYIRAWSENALGYSIDYAEAKIGGTGMTLLVLTILPMGFLGLFVWKRHSFLSFGAAGMWALLAFLALQESTSVDPAHITDIWMALFWMGIILTFICALLPHAMRERTTEEPVELDEVTGEPIDDEDAKPRQRRPRRQKIPIQRG